MFNDCRANARPRRDAKAVLLSLGIFACALATPVCAQQAHINLSGLDTKSGNDRFIVKYRAGTAERSNATALQRGLNSAASRSSGGKLKSLSRLRRMASGAEVVRSNRRLDYFEAQALIRQFATDPNVEYVEIDRLVHPTLLPNDPGFNQQWGLTGRYGIHSEKAWNTTRGIGTVVAVLDTGITSHSDLNANVLPGYDFVSYVPWSKDNDGRDSDPRDPGDWQTMGQCGDGYGPTNSSWHGTLVAGIVAAVGNNARGVAGVAYETKVLPVRVMGTCGGFTSDIADGIVWASGGSVEGVRTNPYPADVINLSLAGWGSCAVTMQDAINSATLRGTTIVAASGNDSANASQIQPASCDNVVVVGSNSSTGERSAFSNYGGKVDISAPGESIVSTFNQGTTAPAMESYGSSAGTSMSAPHVAGVVALMQAASPVHRTPAEIEAILKATAASFAFTPSSAAGYGIVDANRAVEAARTGVFPPASDRALLANGEEVSFAAVKGSVRKYKIAVPAGASDITVRLLGGVGDTRVNIGRDFQPADNNATCSFRYAIDRRSKCALGSADADTIYYIDVKAYSTANARIVIDYVAPRQRSWLKKSDITPGYSSSGNTLRFKMWVPAYATKLEFTASKFPAGSVMYVRLGGEPSERTYSCKAIATGTGKFQCRLPDVGGQIGIYNIDVIPSGSYESATVKGNYTDPDFAYALVKGITAGHASAWPTTQYDELDIPPGAVDLLFSYYSDQPDVDVYVKHGSLPTPVDHDCQMSAGGDDVLRCAFATPSPGPYYTLVVARGAHNTLVLGDYKDPSDNTYVIQPGNPFMVAGEAGRDIQYKLIVPAGKRSVTIQLERMAPGSSDQGMRVKFGSKPTQTSYDCRPAFGNLDSGSTGWACNIPSPRAGAYYITMKAPSPWGSISMRATVK